MEAPRKIYRTTTYLDNDRGKTVWKGHPVAGAENVEYIRKDAFIEKAINYIQQNWIWNIKMIDDFKKYMED
ncbi:MAG: hypothetical protein IJ557_02585 [Bacteroidaceae bacterium]|nr:hypothetical protein [Bacteroidaceae bacterium]